MLRVLQPVPLYFRQFPTLRGGSMQHDCNITTAPATKSDLRTRNLNATFCQTDEIHMFYDVRKVFLDFFCAGAAFVAGHDANTLQNGAGYVNTRPQSPARYRLLVICGITFCEGGPMSNAVFGLGGRRSRRI
jgi:hypothetical protein